MEKFNKNGPLRTLDIEDGFKKKRDELSQQMRKLNREDSIMKKRKEKMYQINVNDEEQSREFSLEDVVTIKKLIISKNINQQLWITTEIRKILSVEESPQIQKVIDIGLIPIFIEFLKNGQKAQLQFEAAWILTNVASGTSEQTFEIIKHGGVEILISLLKNQNENIKSQAVWALGNVSGDSSKFRNIVLEAGILIPLIEEIKNSQKLSFLRNAVWTLSNLCRIKPGLNFDEWQLILPVLTKLIYSDDIEILADVCWSLSYMSDGSGEGIQIIIDSGIIIRICELLIHKDATVQTPSLRTIGNIVTGNDLQTQIVLNCSVLHCLYSLLHSTKKTIKREACWTLSNITAGNPIQIQSVIDSNIIPILIELLKTSEIEVKKEAAWAISNATSGGIKEQIDYLVKEGCLNAMIDFLDCIDTRVIRVLLEGIENILEMGEKQCNSTMHNIHAQHLEQFGGLEKLENLQYHSNSDIYENVLRLLEKYFGAEEKSSSSGRTDEEFEKKDIEKVQIPNCFFGFSEK